MYFSNIVIRYVKLMFDKKKKTAHIILNNIQISFKSFYFILIN